MTPRRATIALVAGILVLAAASIAWWQFAGPLVTRLQTPTATPPPSPTPLPTFAAPIGEFTPPPSLEDWATEFPELAPILSDPELSSAYKEFVVAYQTGGIEAARDLAERRGILDNQDRLRFTLELDTTDTAPIQAELEANGVQVLGVYQNQMDIAVPLSLIETVASQENPGAIFQSLTQLDHVVRVRIPVRASPADDPVVGEGVTTTGADLWHQAGFTGKGVRVGILDMGFGGYDQLLGRGLPQTVVARSFVPGEEPQDSDEVHGTAVTEIVSEMAPDAELYLAYYDGDDVSFGNAVEWLVSQGVQIISNSTGGVVGPMDGTEADSQLVDAVAAQGILWVNSSGNEADVHHRGAYSDADGDGWHDFPNGQNRIGLVAGLGGVRVFLNWDDWDQVTQDFDLYIVDENDNLVTYSEDIQSGLPDSQWPVEVAIDYSVPPGTVLYAGIRAADASRAVTFDLYVDGYGIEFPVADHSLVTPAVAQGALAVGAVDWWSGELVEYSSRGPTNDGRMKPEISAPTGVQSYSYSPDVFTGTSASAPHVSGAAALVWSAFPDFSADQVRQYLLDNAIDLPPAGPDDASGYGALRLPPPPGAEPPTVTAAAATEVAMIATSAPAPVERPTEEATSDAATTVILLTVLCGGMFVCGFGLVVVGGIALIASSGRRRPRPAPPPPPPPPAPVMSAAPPSTTSTSDTFIAGPAVPEATPATRARLESASGKSYELRPEGMTLGRSAECEIALANNQVSRQHAKVYWEHGSWAIADLGSSNGTFVNDGRLEPNLAYRLSSGDTILIGGVGGEKLVFVVA